MLSIVGNIKINDAVRLNYLIATLKSYAFINELQLLLNIDTDCKTLDIITDTVKEIGFKNFELSNKSGNYGKVYCELLDKCTSEYVLNLIEDHFCLLDNKDRLMILLKAMKTERVDVCKSSFSRIEQNSSKEILGHYDINYGLVFQNNRTNHNLYQKHYGSRYYIGVNFITSLAFANIFWSREFDSTRPHEWEISKFNADFEHVAMIPNIEIHASIDDSHGEPGTNLLNRTEPKFWDLYEN